MQVILHLVVISLSLLSPLQADNVTSASRKERFFFIFTPFYRIPSVVPRPCLTPDGREGLCYSNSRCLSLDLIPAGSCTPAGVCCIASKSCGQQSSSAVTYFQNPTALPGKCTLKIHKLNSTITQLRLDFIQFSLQQPVNGRCTNYLMLSQTDTTLPKICGENSGSHVYVDFDAFCEDHTLQFIFGNTAANDKWNIKITQISRESDILAPTGCLMYYASASGVVRSFNFGAVTGVNNRQLSPLNYGVCIKPLPGNCQIKWSLGELSVSSDSACESYVEIPCSVPETVPFVSDRYCTSDFPNPSSNCKPFLLYVVTNIQEGDLAQPGFSLNFQQVAC